MAAQREAARARDVGLAFFDVGVVELLDAAALQAEEVVMVPALVQLEYRLAGLEVLTRKQAGLLELREDAVDRRETHIDALGEERLVDILRGEMPDLARLEALEDLSPGQCRLEPAVLKALHRAHRLSLYAAMQRWLRLLLVLAVASCGFVPQIPGVKPYRIEIQQGNYISPEAIATLQPGMSKEQVRLALGTPLLTDIFHADRWDYVYWRDRPGAKREQRKLTVYFEDGKLTRLDGDPGAAGATQ